MGDGDEDVNESRAEGSALLLFGEQLSEQQQKKRVRGERVFHSWHQMDSTLVAFCCLSLLSCPEKLGIICER
jgi:hypothetical protein